MKKFSEIREYFENISRRLKNVERFFSSQAEFEANPNISSLTMVLEEIDFRVVGVGEDRPARELNVYFQFWLPIKDLHNSDEIENAKTELMEHADQVVAKMDEDHTNFDPVDFDFIRELDRNSFDFIFIRYGRSVDKLGIRGQVTFHAAPNFEIIEELWN
jgi:hypothetical protein